VVVVVVVGGRDSSTKPIIGRRPSEASLRRKPLPGKDCESGDLNPDPFRDWILSPVKPVRKPFGSEGF
jgi:hypothetical protein